MALASVKVSFFSPSAIVSDGLKRKTNPSLSFTSSLSLANIKGSSGNFIVNALPQKNSDATAVIFEPFEEIKKDFLTVPLSPNVSMARQNYQDDCEAAINEQIKLVKNDIFFLIFFFLLYSW